MKIKTSQIDNKEVEEAGDGGSYMAGSLAVSHKESFGSLLPQSKIEVEVSQYDAAEALGTPRYTVAANKDLLDDRVAKLTGVPVAHAEEDDTVMLSGSLVNIGALETKSDEAQDSYYKLDAQRREMAAKSFLLDYKMFAHRATWAGVEDYAAAGVDVEALFDALDDGAGAFDERDADGKGRANLYKQLAELQRMTERGITYLEPFPGTETDLKAQSLADAPYHSVQTLSDWSNVESSSDLNIWYRDPDMGWVEFKYIMDEAAYGDSLAETYLVSPVEADQSVIADELLEMKFIAKENVDLISAFRQERQVHLYGQLEVLKSSFEQRKATGQGVLSNAAVTISVPLAEASDWGSDFGLDKTSEANLKKSLRISINGIRQSKSFLDNVTAFAADNFDSLQTEISLSGGSLTGLEDGDKVHVDVVYRSVSSLELNDGELPIHEEAAVEMEEIINALGLDLTDYEITQELF